MSQATKRKHVAREVLEEFVTPTENQQIVKLIAGRGNNLHQVQTACGETFLVSMPTKFRKNVWIKRGDFVVIEPIDEGVKVKAEIVHILYKHQIRHLKQDGLWPKQFDDTSKSAHSLKTLDSNRDSQSEASDNNTGESEDDDDDLFVNTNRLNVTRDESTDCSSSSDSEMDEEK